MAARSFHSIKLHARLYLLIAFARISIDYPRILQEHYEIFSEAALEGMSHVLIQKNAADIALRIERASPGTYTHEMLAKLCRVGKSSLPLDSKGKTRSSARFRGGEDPSIAAPFEQEFDWYWFDQISEIFNVPKSEVKNIARDIAAQEFSIKPDESHQPDPRQEQWNSAGYRESGTSHSHGSYPCNDTYSFYISYHSFLGAAMTLLARCPIVADDDGWHSGDRWAAWVRRHSLTLSNGRWLADDRDPTPVARRPWVYLPKNEHWESSINRDDFVDILMNTKGLPGFLCVHGAWSDCSEYRIENISVQSALVNRDTATALASSLRFARDSQAFSLPIYGDEETKIEKSPFELVGWIHQREFGDSRLDRFDPYAKDLSHPALEIGASFAELLKLSLDGCWEQAGMTCPAVFSTVWSNQESNRPDDPFRSRPVHERIRLSP